MLFSVLGSGSGGNSIYIESGETAFLIDCGFSGRETAARLASIGRNISDLAAIFVTHEHHDHISGVGVLSRRCRIPVCANEGTFRGAASLIGKAFNFREFATGDPVEFQDLQVRPFPVSHDAADPVGFIVEDGTHRLGVCTDTGLASRLITARLAGCDGLVIEFNHDLELLKNGPYPPALKQRVRSNHGHLSNPDGARLLAAVAHAGLQHVVLAHLSETNNLPDLAYREAVAAIPADDARLIISLARQQRPTVLFTLR